MTQAKHSSNQRVKNPDGSISDIKVDVDSTAKRRAGQYHVDPKDAPENKPPAKQASPGKTTGG